MGVSDGRHIDGCHPGIGIGSDLVVEASPGSGLLLEGEGVLTDMTTGCQYDIRPGTLYALDRHERHRLQVHKRMRVICTFVPPLSGGEIHKADGSYPVA